LAERKRTVHGIGVVDVRVRSEDVWTTNPGISVSRAGGENKFGAEIEELNLFGRGKQLSAGYTHDVDRTSLGVAWRDPAVWGSRWTLLLVGLVVLVPPWLALVFLRALPQGEYLLIYVIALIAFADMGAFFAGRRIGGPKLMPRVSPGKTWAGFAGGVCASLLLALAVGVGFGFAGAQLALWCVLAVLTAVASVFGDLLESMVKRHGGQKDSGSLLPGHGGLLDRLDSLSAGLPVFAFVLARTGLVP
ncbi:MAG TPA: phosphatidate cytidylyltransferase, partial [Pseudomonadales bacterium]|nr:phosphatidate cytidylyltransferase [Pseudomonadales bacterium]